MSLQLHMRDAHLEKFKDHTGDYTEEQSERCYQYVKKIERGLYQCRYNDNMMRVLDDGIYIWGLVRECDLEYNCKSKKSSYFLMFVIVVEAEVVL